MSPDIFGIVKNVEKGKIDHLSEIATEFPAMINCSEHDQKCLAIITPSETEALEILVRMSEKGPERVLSERKKTLLLFKIEVHPETKA